MAITDVQAIAFSNEQVRPAADVLESAYNTAKRVLQDWASQDMASLIPNDAGEQLFDGAEADGRPIINGADVHNIINRLTELVTDYEAAGFAKLNTITAVAVNGESRV